MSSRKSEVVTFRLAEGEREKLQQDAGGRSKVSAYLRGMIRGARLVSQADNQSKGGHDD